MTQVRQRLKYLYRIIDQRAGSDQPPLLAVSIHHGVVPRSSLTDDRPRAEDLRNYKLCEPGDVVLNRMRAFQGAIGVSSERGLVSPDYMVLRPREDLDVRYLHHLFRSAWFVGEMAARLRGIGGTESGNVRTPRINPEDLGEIEVDLPPLEEQRRIADFLDAETGYVDKIISLRYKQIDTLKERAQVLCDGAIVGDPDILRSLGIPAAPEKAKRVKISWICRITPGFAFPSQHFSHDSDDYRLLRGINVGVNKIDWEDSVYWPRGRMGGLQRFYLKAGDLVLGMDRPWISSGFRIATVSERDLPALLLQRVARVRPGPDADTGYVKWALSSTHFRKSVEGELTGVSVPHLSGEQIGSFSIVLPALDLQRKISDQLHAVVNAMHATVDSMEVQCRLMEERRRAVVTAAVTGELDVTTARRVS